MRSGYISAAGPSLLTVTVWTGLVMLFKTVYNPRYVRKVSDRRIRDRKIIQIDLKIDLHELFDFSSLSALFISSKCWLSMLSLGSLKNVINEIIYYYYSFTLFVSSDFVGRVVVTLP